MSDVADSQMMSDNLTDFDVVKTTTDKLEDTLRGWSEPWKIYEVVFTGGRDWVVIATCEWDSLEAKCDGYGTDPSTPVDAGTP